MREKVSLEVEPAGKHQPDPKAKSLTIKKKEITVEEANQAATRAGMKTVNATHIRGHKVLGDYIEQEGAIPVGRSMLVLAHQNLGTGMAKCAELLADSNNSASFEDLILLMKAMHDLAKVQVDAANGLIKSAELSNAVNPNGDQQVKSFGARQIVVPMSIEADNITINKGKD